MPFLVRYFIDMAGAPRVSFFIWDYAIAAVMGGSKVWPMTDEIFVQCTAVEVFLRFFWR